MGSVDLGTSDVAPLAMLEFALQYVNDLRHAVALGHANLPPLNFVAVAPRPCPAMDLET